RACFFFSGRRRHTRFSRDWSSDVCSSDLTPGPGSRSGVEGQLPHHQDGNENEPLVPEPLPLCLPPLRTTSVTRPTTVTRIGSHFFICAPPSVADSKNVRAAARRPLVM